MDDIGLNPDLLEFEYISEELQRGIVVYYNREPNEKNKYSVSCSYATDTTGEDFVKNVNLYLKPCLVEMGRELKSLENES